MANDLPTLVTALRNALLDTSVAYLWPDTNLQQAIQEAVTEHSYLFPRLVYTSYDVANAQQDFTLGSFDPSFPSGPNPPPSATTDLISVIGAECPPGTPIPEDPWASSEPAPASASRSAQGYRWRQGALRLRVAATGGQVGSAKLVVIAAQTWNMPDNSNPWNGPNTDVPLLLLLGKRGAYQLLAEWQARQQGLPTPTIPSGEIDVHLDVAPILAALEVQIQRALDLRAARTAAYPPLGEGE